MKLEAITARVRMRRGLRASDFGVALARRWWTTYMPAWCLITIPFFAAAAALVLWAGLNPGLAVFGLWWLKPLFDRVVIFVLSRAFFGEEMSHSKTLSLTISSWLRWPALAQITLLRLIPIRGSLDPMLELERPSMSKASKRYGTLLGGFDAHGLFLGTAMEWVFVGAAWTVVAMVVPQTIEYDAWLIGEAIFDGVHAPGMGSLAVLIYWLAITLVEPFFVASGFASYINRRVALEGWDIELTFRRLAERLRRRASDALADAGSKVALFVAASLAALVCLASPADGFAQDRMPEDDWAYEEAVEPAGYGETADAPEGYEKAARPTPYYDDDGVWISHNEDGSHPAGSGIGPYDANGNYIEAYTFDDEGNRIEGPGYYNEMEEWVAAPGYFDDEGNFIDTSVSARGVVDGRIEREITDPKAKILEIVSGNEFGETVTEEVWRLRDKGEPEVPTDPDLSWLNYIATAMQFLAYFITALILGGLVYFIIKRLRVWERKSAPPTPEVESIVLPDGREIPLSKTWLDQVLPAWNKGDRIYALSLLYRGTITDLEGFHGIKIPASATARETVRGVREAGGPHAFVREVAGLWTREVYAGRGPETVEVERAVIAYRELRELRSAS